MNAEFWRASCTGIAQCEAVMPYEWCTFSTGVAVGAFVAGAVLLCALLSARGRK